jgi:hypothetical protein
VQGNRTTQTSIVIRTEPFGTPVGTLTDGNCSSLK